MAARPNDDSGPAKAGSLTSLCIPDTPIVRVSNTIAIYKGLTLTSGALHKREWKALHKREMEISIDKRFASVGKTAIQLWINHPDLSQAILYFFNLTSFVIITCTLRLKSNSFIMKVAATLLVSAWLLFAPVLGDGHSLCACQSRSNGPTVDSATQACCSRVGAQLSMNAWIFVES
ncbi:hypothetical protein BKA56DRAFT_620268 [Ilyonectria sp. MPI-CAGE-AT-0026]|nr:hypothetical protein BKA56DRAFT_620268 [Ilyonectria sp. MPI-CAGE-AT-0026]